MDQDVEDLTHDDDEVLLVKRSKHFADKNASAPKAARESAASTGSKRKSPGKPAAAVPVAEKRATARASNKASPAGKKSAKPAGKGRKAVVIDDDSDDDFQVQLAHNADQSLQSQ